MVRGERVIGILAAGGAGLRAGVAKQWLVLGGETVLRRSARALAACEAVDALVAVVLASARLARREPEMRYALEQAELLSVEWASA